MSKLPPESPLKSLPEIDIVGAYQCCLNLEKDIEEKILDGEDIDRKKKNLMYCRVLGYLLHHAPNDTALAVVTQEILSCETIEAILILGKFYFEHFISVFKAHRGRTPTPSTHPSRPSFQTTADIIKPALKDTTKSHRASKKLALKRDKFRCILSGSYDEASLDADPELDRWFQTLPDGQRNHAHTQCAHIIPRSINSGISENSVKGEYATNVWSVLKLFGYGTLPEELNGDNIHRLENVMTLGLDVHMSFDSLNLWLVATGQPNEYKANASNTRHLHSIPELVTFQTDDEVNLPVPKPEYLALHATCAQVAHLSGAAEYVNLTMRDLEEIPVLASDGSSAHLLEQALLYTSYVRTQELQTGEGIAVV